MSHDEVTHPSPDAPGQGPAMLEHLRRECDHCVVAWLAGADPARRLIEWAREAGWTSAAHVEDDDLVRLRLCDVEMSDALSYAAHLAGCARCMARLEGPAVGEAVDRRERRDAEAVDRFVAQVLHQAPPPSLPAAEPSPRAAPRRRYARVAMAVTLAAAAALVAMRARRPSTRGAGGPRPEAVPEATAGPPRAPPRPRGPDGGVAHPDLLEQDLCRGDQTRTCRVPRLRGACMNGLQRCTGTLWSACAQTVSPVAERCDNGVDDDCDGAIDEDCGCVGDLTTLEAPTNHASVVAGERVTFRWAPSSCPARPLLFRVRDLTTGALVLDDVPVSGTSFTASATPPRFVAGHDYRWTLRVEAPSAPTGEFAAQFFVFSVR